MAALPLANEMNQAESKTFARSFVFFKHVSIRWTLSWLLVICGCTADSRLTTAKAAPSFNVTGFTVEGRWILSTNVMVPLFSKYAGANVSLEDIIHAASDLDVEYMHEGYPAMNIVIAPKRIMNGIVTLDVFPGAVAQIVVAGNRYLVASNGIVAVPPLLEIPPTAPSSLAQKSPAPPNAATNTGPRFTVNKYEITGNSLLPPNSLGETLTNVPGAFGTNVSIDAIREVVSQLDAAYRARGYVTVAVGLPPQRLTNATIKLKVTEEQLSDILVKGNHYFSSNNVMRALPGLYPGMILNGLTFQAELNRANANQDRQIYSLLEPGPDPGTADLTLQVKDRLPLHAKVEFNNQSSPGTPDLRANASATYNNLWNYEHELGMQYSFSPFDYKLGPQWNLYDLPLVANYSAFYRMPLGNPETIDETVSANPGTFGYNEATRKFTLPPASGQPDLTFFASRSTIDTGLELLSSSVLFNQPGVESIAKNYVQDDFTENNDLGVHLNVPLAASDDVHWNVSAGLDFKTYETLSAATNIFIIDQITLNAEGLPNPPIVSAVDSPVPLTDRRIEYLPLSLGLNGSWRASSSTITWGLGLSANLWHSGTRNNLDAITSSTKSIGNWVSLTPSFSWQFPIHTNWLTTVRMDGQVTTEPLISVEQFGIGGVNSVRGYHEGEVFGDDGWHASVEQLTPPHTVGMVFGRFPLVVRGSIYMDYAQIYLLDAPTGAPDTMGLWGTGVGCVASIGSFWETRFLFSLPLLKTADTQTYNPFFNFALTAQF